MAWRALGRNCPPRRRSITSAVDSRPQTHALARVAPRRGPRSRHGLHARGPGCGDPTLPASASARCAIRPQSSCCLITLFIKINDTPRMAARDDDRYNAGHAGACDQGLVVHELQAMLEEHARWRQRRSHVLKPMLVPPWSLPPAGWSPSHSCGGRPLSLTAAKASPSECWPWCRRPRSTPPLSASQCVADAVR